MTVYFIEIEKIGSIKIGYTGSHPERRLAQLQTGQPEKLRLLGTIPGEKSDEYNLHKELSEYRINGEWFSSKIFPIIMHLIESGGPWYLCREPKLINKRMEIEWESAFCNSENNEVPSFSEKEIFLAAKQIRAFEKASRKFRKNHGWMPYDVNHPIYKIKPILNREVGDAAKYITAFSLG